MNAMEQLIRAAQALGEALAPTLQGLLSATSNAITVQAEVDLLFGPSHDEVPTPAALDVLAERRRQLSAQHYTPEHDDGFTQHELVDAAVCYADADVLGLDPGEVPETWPWNPAYWKPKDRRRDLVRAAALLLAEIERLDRAAARNV